LLQNRNKSAKRAIKLLIVNSQPRHIELLIRLAITGNVTHYALIAIIPEGAVIQTLHYLEAGFVS
jgi:hypothetical protein